MAVSNSIAFANPNAPVYPRLAQGKVWNEVSFWHIKYIDLAMILLHLACLSFSLIHSVGQDLLLMGILFVS